MIDDAFQGRVQEFPRGNAQNFRAPKIFENMLFFNNNNNNNIFGLNTSI